MKRKTIDYRLAPEYSFPAALHDSVKVYKWILSQNVSSQDLVFVGDSAGGGLCLTTLLYLREYNLPFPAAKNALRDICSFIISHIEK